MCTLKGGQQLRERRHQVLSVSPTQTVASIYSTCMYYNRKTNITKWLKSKSAQCLKDNENLLSIHIHAILKVVRLQFQFSFQVLPIVELLQKLEAISYYKETAASARVWTNDSVSVSVSCDVIVDWCYVLQFSSINMWSLFTLLTYILTYLQWEMNCNK